MAVYGNLIAVLKARRPSARINQEVSRFVDHGIILSSFTDGVPTSFHLHTVG